MRCGCGCWVAAIGRACPWWETRAAGALLALAFAIPLLWPAFPPLVDLPGHMARYHVALDAGRTPSLARAFGYEWAPIGNLGVDLAVFPLAALIGVEPATRLIVLLIPVLTVAGMLGVAKAAHGRVPATAVFALPLALGWPFQLGFVNYCLAMALALLALAAWIAMARAGRPGRRAIVFVAVAWVIWLCHALGWGMFGVLAFGAELARYRQAGRRWPRAAGAAMVQCLPLATPLLAMIGGTATGAETTGWLDAPAKLAAIASMLRDHWMPLDLVSVLILAGVLYGGARSLGYSALLGLPAVLAFVAFLAMPQMLFGGAFADVRVAPYAAALAILAIRPSTDARAARRIAVFGGLFVAVRLVAATASLAINGADLDRELAALPAIPRGAAVFALVARPCEGEWDRRRIDHLPGMAILRRDAFANDQWAMPGQQLLTIRDTGAAPFDRDPSQFATDRPCGMGALDIDTALARFDRGRFDHVWTIGFPQRRRPGLVPIWANGGSALYRIEQR